MASWIRSPAGLFVFWIICLLDLDYSTNVNAASCLQCFQCLPRSSEKITFTNNKPPCSWTSAESRAVFYCPKVGQIEHFYSRQLLYLYPKEQEQDKLPCYAACQGCVDTVRSKCPDITPLGRSYLQDLYPGLVQVNGSKKIPPDSTPYPPTCNVKDEDEGRKKRSDTCESSPCCVTDSMTLPYTTTHTINGTPLFPIWFDDDGPGNSPAMYQLVNYVTCSEGSSCSECNVVQTTRTIVMTTWYPNLTYGHKYAIFCDWILDNIQFVYVKVPGYCQCIN